MMSSLNAIVPMTCVTAAAIAAMTAEAFREPGERIPIGPLGVIGLIGAAIASLALWNHNATSFGVVSADNFGLFVTWILIVVGVLSLAISAPTSPMTPSGPIGMRSPGSRNASAIMAAIAVAVTQHMGTMAMKEANMKFTIGN